MRDNINNVKKKIENFDVKKKRRASKLKHLLTSDIWDGRKILDIDDERKYLKKSVKKFEYKIKRKVDKLAELIFKVKYLKMMINHIKDLLKENDFNEGRLESLISYFKTNSEIVEKEKKFLIIKIRLMKMK